MTRYGAVRTTGIYCRPGCGAQPKPGNVCGFPSPAAAEAEGYRACLRCRPWRTPPVETWCGPEVVCRALRLVLDGALDGHCEEELAARVGVSARHLRRLFLEHAGVTPDGVARSARAHFARRLIDDTDLPMASIAFASGYNSVRQFNRSMTQVFRAPPLTLRAKRRRSDRLVADGGLVLRLRFQPPLDWGATIGSLAARAIPGVEAVSGSEYRRTITVGGDPGVIEARPGGEDSLTLSVHLPHWGVLIHLVERARRLFGLDFDLDAANADLNDDPLVGTLVGRRPGVRQLGAWDPFETAVAVVARHRWPGPGPGRGAGAGAGEDPAGVLVARLGHAVPGLGPLGLRAVFPTPVTLAGARPDQTGLDPELATTLVELARRVATGLLHLDGSVQLDRLVTELSAVPGVDRDLSEAVAYAIGERDALPGGWRDLAEVAIAAGPAANRWRPWSGLVGTHLELSRDVARGTR